MDLNTVSLDTNFILSFSLMVLIILRLLTLGKDKKKDDLTYQINSILDILKEKKEESNEDKPKRKTKD